MFEATELGTDYTFTDMPKQAQEIALQVIAECKGCVNPERCIVRELDCNADFRDAISMRNFDIYPRQVDVVVRYYKYINENRVTI
jgi:hypothetical protein